MRRIKALDQASLQASFVSDPVGIPAFVSRAAFGVVVDNGAGGAPVDSPSGALTVEVSFNGADWFVVDDATTPLAAASPSGNNALVRKLVILHGLPGAQLRVRYTRASGGAASRISVWVELVAA